MAAGAAAAPAAAESLQLCDRSPPMTARQQDKLLRFAALVRQELDTSGARVALVARSGLDLQRFGVRYSHAGISLKTSRNTPWSVRQLYYSCNERRPRLYDQGLPGFLFGTDDPTLGYISVVLLPDEPAAALETAALDNARALRLLAGTYSANAFAWSLRYQNCNQWVAELLAAAWGGLADTNDLRAQAQQWLHAQGYVAPPVDVGSHLLMFAAQFVPFVHLDDHPEDDRFALKLRVSLPAAIDGFVHRRLPGAQRLEFCHDGARMVVRRGWGAPLAEGCRPEPGDTVIALD
jgi:hypothetical protein